MSRATEYKLVFEIIRSVITEWDPYGLLAGGAPDDEFDSEVAQLAVRISEMKSGEEAAKVISEIFSKNFEPGLFLQESCVDVGSKLYERLSAEGVINNAV